MPDLSSEFRKNVPYFYLNEASGGSAFNTIESENSIGWEAYTSRKRMSFEMMNEGFRVMAADLGMGILYDTQGDLDAVRINIVSFLYGLLEVQDDGTFDEENLGEMIDLVDFLENSGNEYIVHVDAKDEKCAIYGVNMKTGEQKVMANQEKLNFSRSPVVLMVSFEETRFGIIIHRFEDNFGIGIGVEGELDDSPSPIGDLPNDINGEEDGQKVSMLSVVLSTDCNYTTFLDSKRTDRFERLARRIIRS